MNEMEKNAVSLDTNGPRGTVWFTVMIAVRGCKQTTYVYESYSNSSRVQ